MCNVHTFKHHHEWTHPSQVWMHPPQAPSPTLSSPHPLQAQSQALPSPRFPITHLNFLHIHKGKCLHN